MSAPSRARTSHIVLEMYTFQKGLRVQNWNPGAALLNSNAKSSGTRQWGCNDLRASNFSHGTFRLEQKSREIDSCDRPLFELVLAAHSTWSVAKIRQRKVAAGAVSQWCPSASETLAT